MNRNLSQKIMIALIVTNGLFSGLLVEASEDKEFNRKLAETQRRMDERTRELGRRYLELFNQRDPHYLLEDPICAAKRAEEKAELENKAPRDAELEKKIGALCTRTGRERFRANAQRFQNGFTSAVKIMVAGSESGLPEEIAHRVRHHGLSKETHEIVLYPHLDVTLAEKCGLTRDEQVSEFIDEMLIDGGIPSALGVTSGVAGGYWVLKTATQLVIKPIQKKWGHTKPCQMIFHKKTKKILWGTIGGLTALGVYVAVDETREKALEDQENAERSAYMTLDSLFPEIAAQEALTLCHEAIERHNATPVALREVWLQNAKSRCGLYVQKVKYALRVLKTDDTARCHPGNAGSAERLIKELDEQRERYSFIFLSLL